MLFFYLLLVSMFRFPISLIHSLWISFCIFLSYFSNLQLLPDTFSLYPPHFMFFFISEKNKKTRATIKCAIQFKITKYEARHGLCVKSSVTSLVNWLPLSRQPPFANHFLNLTVCCAHFFFTLGFCPAWACVDLEYAVSVLALISASAQLYLKNALLLKIIHNLQLW